MAKKRKDATPQTFRLDARLVERLDRYSAATGVPKTFAVERALEAYLAERMPAGEARDEQFMEGTAYIYGIK